MSTRANSLLLRFLLLPVLALFLAPGCTSLRESSRPPLSAQVLFDDLDTAEALLRQADREHFHKNRYMVLNLRAAEIANGQLSSKNTATTNRAEGIYDRAVGNVATQIIGATTDSETFQEYGLSYTVSQAYPRRHGYWNPARLTSARLASDVPRRLLHQWFERGGIGAPLAISWRPDTNSKLAAFTSESGGYITPATALVSFKPGKDAPTSVSLTLVDPGVVRTMKGRTVAANFSAPIVDRTLSIREFWEALTAALRPEVLTPRLIMLEPYDPKKTPVILVHGLFSHPRMWRNVVNELQADPELQGKIQIWTYHYPTGWPITYSALNLRNTLAQLEKVIGPQPDMIFVGHSMGGLLSRMQVSSSNPEFLKTLVPNGDIARFESLPPDHLARQALEFDYNPHIQRVIFISTPHRGSRMADRSISRWFSSLIQLPSTISSAAIELGFSHIGATREMSSIRRLSPANPLYAGLEKTPMKVPYHSIIGDRGRGDTPNSTDGIVPYWSSHLDGAESELIVPAGHGAFDDPAAIAEVRRIIRLSNLR